MNTRRLHPLILAGGLLLACLPPPDGARASDAPDPEQYRYEERDPAREQQTFLARLKADKEKLDLAIENTKLLIDRSRQRPYLPELYLRLAELYVEKSRTVFYIRKTEMPAGVKSLSNLESNTLKKQAIEVYTRILTHYPDFPDRDKVLFFMAHEFRELGEIEPMVARYRELIRTHPRSRYAAEAHLLLGDHYFNSQDLDQAMEHYGAVLGYTDSPALAVARYKLAWCYINRADYAKAIALFEAAVVAAKADADVDIDTYRKVDIKLESLIDMAFCYCEQYKDATPEEAIRYFEGYAWSRPALTVALEKLANRYFIKKKWDHSAAVYRKLATLQHEPEKLLEYAARVFECVRATGSFAQADQDMGLIIKALRRQKVSIHIPAETKERNLKQYELYARDIVTQLHQKALATQAQESFRLAAAAYKEYLGFFDRSEVRDEMRLNYAETLFSAEEYVEAGKQFEAIAAEAPQSEREREENLYSAVLAYYSGLKEGTDLSAYDKVYARAGLREVGKRYAAEYPTTKNVAKVLFNVAWVAYDEGKYATAIDEFAKFVDAHPKTPEATAAIHLILDAYNLTEDYEGLVSYGHKILNRPGLDPKVRGEVGTIVKAAESKVLYPVALAAADDWQAGKENLIQFAESHEDTALGEQALQAVVASSAELRDLDTLFTSAGQLMEKYPTSEHLEQTLNVLIDTCIQASQFRRLAHYLEEFARRLPQHGSRTEFLLKAAQIRDRLGQAEAASEDYGLLLQAGLAKGMDRGEVVLAATRTALAAGAPELGLKLALDQQKQLSGTARIKLLARVAGIYQDRGDAAKSRAFREQLEKAYQKNLDLRDHSLVDAVAEVEFRALDADHARYMALQLTSASQSDVVQQKGDLYGALLKAYHKVMQLQSPRWALAACYRAYEINREFARFLAEAPLPDLPEEQKAQYVAIVAEKAKGYAAKGEEYLGKCRELAEKWEICDADLAPYFMAAPPTPRAGRSDASAPTVAIDGDWLQRPSLRPLHLAVLKDPQNLSALAALAAEYVRLGDHRQAILIAETALERTAEAPPALKASLYNTLGVARCYCGEDEAGKAAFQKALDAEPDQVAARVNLAGLYQHYEHRRLAQAIYAGLGLDQGTDGAGGLIHPRSEELYHAFTQSARL